MKRVILFIVGRSGSGKDLLAEMLKGRGVSKVVSYTTRPLRKGEKLGQNHWHVPLEGFKKPKDTFAYTIYGEHHYYTTDCQILSAPEIKSYIVDEDGVLYAKERQKLEKYKNVIPVYIKIDVSEETLKNRGISSERIARDKGRVGNIPNDKYDYVISNNGTPQELIKQGEHILKDVCKKHNINLQNYKI